MVAVASKTIPSLRTASSESAKNTVRYRLNRGAAGILAFFTHRITNGLSEGINNLIKVLKRRAYGFGDFRYFTLKILDATGALPPLEALDYPHF